MNQKTFEEKNGNKEYRRFSTENNIFKKDKGIFLDYIFILSKNLHNRNARMTGLFTQFPDKSSLGTTKHTPNI